MLALFHPAALMRSGSSQGGIKCQVKWFARCGTGLDITPACLFRFGARAASALLADHLIQRGIQFARVKRFADFGFFAAIPPMSGSILKNLFAFSRRAALIRPLFSDRILTYFFFVRRMLLLPASSSGLDWPRLAAPCRDFNAFLKIFHGHF